MKSNRIYVKHIALCIPSLSEFSLGSPLQGNKFLYNGAKFPNKGLDYQFTEACVV